MKGEGGFTLVELMITVALIAIFLSMATLLFSQLNVKYTIEADTKEIYGVLMKARNDAALSNTAHLVILNANQVQAGRDANNDGVIDGTPMATINTGFTVTCGAVACAGGAVVFDRRGLTNNQQTIRIAGPPNVTPALNCIVIANTRINLGRFDQGGICVQQ